MKTINLKIAVLISFLIIPLPSPHFTVPNGIFQIFLLFQSFWSFFYEDFNQEMVVESLINLTVCISLLFVILKNKKINLCGVIIQFSWIIYVFKYKFLNYWYVTIPTLLYLILSLTLLYFLFLKKEVKKEIL